MRILEHHGVGCRDEDELIDDGLASDVVYAQVDADIHQAIIHQIYGTPTFVINGFKAENLDQTTTYAQWVAYLDNLLYGNTTSTAASSTSVSSIAITANDA